MSTVIAAASALTALNASVGENTSPLHHQNPGATAGSPNAGEHAAKRVRAEGSPVAWERPALPERSGNTGKTSPLSLRAGPPPAIKVKKEPGSPSLPSARPRPKRLDLSSNTALRGPQTARPLGSRDSAGLAIQDVGLACLSPGFQTNDPSMREQLQRSMDVREQQRILIESRQKGARPPSGRDGDNSRAGDMAGPQSRVPMTARRKGPPPGLSINAPSAAQFANDRVIQSAPMHQTFTGLRPGEHPFARYVGHGASNLSQTSHVHHVPATQTSNRLPPISDVFPHDRLDQHRTQASSPPGHSHHLPPVPSPGFPPSNQLQPPESARPREFRSADEAVQSLTGGRDELMPKVVHYGGIQPPTPPSPLPAHYHQEHSQYSRQPPSLRHTVSTSQIPSRPEFEHSASDPSIQSSFANGRRRGRDEYERDNISPPMTFQRAEAKRATFVDRVEERHSDEMDWRHGLSSGEKKEEFMRLMERAWDLFHS